MNSTFHIAATLAVGAFGTAYMSGRLNKPYPWNSNCLDYIQGLSVLVFIPAFFTAVIQGIWQL